MRPAPSSGDDTSPEHFPTRWINRDEALRLIARGKVTLWKWERAGMVRRKNRGGIHVFEAGELLRARDEYEARFRRSQFQPGNNGNVDQRGKTVRAAPTVDGDNVQFPKHWVTKPEALRLIGRCDHTLWRWTRAGIVRKKMRSGQPVWETSELLNGKTTMRNSYRGRRRTAGTGRPRHPARPQIQQMIQAGIRNCDIAQELGCSRTLVAKVRKETGLDNDA